jgi:hypothetical protein
VNPESARGWVVERNTLTANKGAAVFMGSDTRISYNCIDANGQYGLSGYRPQLPTGNALTNVTVDHNEISNNNTDDWETKQPGCGCTGGAKFWDIGGARITDNYVHHNKGVGLWADMNDVDFLFEGNYFEANDDEALFYEVSYNTAIRNNAFVRNSHKKGQAFASRGDTFPVAAIYLSQADGDARMSSAITGTSNIDISGNYFEDNWAGITLWEAAERFCNSPAHGTDYCTKVNPSVANLVTCTAGTINNEPYYSDCRWKTKNVKVHDNTFKMNTANVGNCSTAYCGRMAIIASWGTAYPPWSPYLGTVVQDALTFRQGNIWSNNTYVGSWRFTPYDTSRNLDFEVWRAAPYNQDAHSTMSTIGTVATTTTTTATTTTTVAPPTTRLDPNTSTFESYLERLAPWWYSSTLERSTTNAPRA